MKKIPNLYPRLQNRTAQCMGGQSGFAKYIVLTLEGREQVTVFPFKAKHSEVYAYIKGQAPDAQAVSAGFFFDHAGVFWAGGESDSLNLKSRPQDKGLIQSFLSSPDRRQWDLTLLAAEAGRQS